MHRKSKKIIQKLGGNDNLSYLCSGIINITMNTAANKTEKASMALKKAIEVRRAWMQALSGKISKEELEAKGIRFMAVSE